MDIIGKIYARITGTLTDEELNKIHEPSFDVKFDKVMREIENEQHNKKHII